MSRLHSAAASDMPPKQPTRPAMTADDGNVAAQRDDGCMDLRDRGEPEVGLLQPHPAGLEQQQPDARVGRAAQSRSASSSAPAIFAPETSPMLPP